MRKRIICLMVAVSIALTSLSVRIGYIMFNNEFTASSGYNSYTLRLESPDFQLYYSNGLKLTNNKKQYVAVIKPTEKCVGELYKFFSFNEYKKITEELSKGYPIAIEINNKIDSKYIEVFEIYKSEYNCPQLINKSSSGLLKYVQKPSDGLKISFSVDAKGRLLSGDNGTIYRNDTADNESLTLTLDKGIQSIAVNACSDMQSGCCIVMDVNSGGILACVNKPDETYINKCFMNYSVGSVFKIIVALSALENGISPIYNCKGSIEIGDSIFSCQNKRNHGYQTLKTALANSCNCYFVNLALTLGTDKLLNTAEKLGFGDKVGLYNGWSISTSQLPDKAELTSKGQLALLGFGQGSLLATPLQICSALCTIGNKGLYNEPHIIKNFGSSRQVVARDNTKTMLSYMRYVVENGTGANADDSRHKSAGKTATAQTGQYLNGNELLNTWFAGLYPYDNPQYAIVIMNENGTSGSADCCPIFRTIVENIK